MTTTILKQGSPTSWSNQMAQCNLHFTNDRPFLNLYYHLLFSTFQCLPVVLHTFIISNCIIFQPLFQLTRNAVVFFYIVLILYTGILLNLQNPTYCGNSRFTSNQFLEVNISWITKILLVTRGLYVMCN